MTTDTNTDFNNRLVYVFTHLPSKKEVEVFIDSKDSGKVKNKHAHIVNTIQDLLEKLDALVNDPVNRRKGDPVKAWHDYILSLESAPEKIEHLVTLSIAGGNQVVMMFINSLCKKLQLHDKNDELRKAAISGLDRLYAVNVIFDRRVTPR